MEAEEAMKNGVPTSSTQNHSAYYNSSASSRHSSQDRNPSRSSEFSESRESYTSDNEALDSARVSLLDEPIEHHASIIQNTKMDEITNQVHERMIQMGMYKENLPSRHALAHCSIFLSEDWQRCDKLIVFVGNSHGGGGGRTVPPGIWSRSGCESLGIEYGSMLAYLATSQAGGYGSIVLDTATHSKWITQEDGSRLKMSIEHSETAEKHIALVWEKFVLHAHADSVFVIAYGIGGECFKEFLETHTHLLFSNKLPILQG